MHISINDERQEVPEGCTVTQMLGICEIDDLTGLAIALNSTVIPRTEWDTHILKDTDTVLIFSATQGG